MTSEPKTSEPIKAMAQLAAIMVFYVCLIFLHSAALIGIAGAALFTVALWSHPHLFRSRGGSLTPAFYLVAMAWLGAAVTVFFTVIGGH